jgi:diguanylate cyclase (GGDEF)-like protein
MSISDITKKTLKTITINGDAITPLIFFETFCREARRDKVIMEDCELISTYIEKLDKDFKSEAKRYNIRNIQEFLSYLVSALNRMNQNHLAQRHHSLLELTQKIVEVVARIDNNDFQNLAGRTNAMLERGHTATNLDSIKKEWSKFSLSYRPDRNREKLSQFVPIDMHDDLDKIVDKVVPILEESKKPKANQKIVELLFNSVTPSLKLIEDKETEKLYRNLRANPENIFNHEVQKQIEELYNKRLDIDRKAEKENINKVSNLVNDLTDTIQKEHEKIAKNDFTKDIQELENDLNHADEVQTEIKEEKSSNNNSDNSQTNIEKHQKPSNSFFNLIGSKVKNLVSKSSSMFDSLKNSKHFVSELQEKIEKFENDLKNERANIDRDLLTNLKNKKGFEHDIEEIELEYQQTNNNYSIAVIDIDNFRNIVDIYGNDAGDLILRYFSKILKEYIGVGDSIARYGNDRFIVSFPEKNLSESFQVIEKFQDKVKHTKFVYKKERVVVTFSAGIADRVAFENFNELLDKANQLVLQAKERGKNQICSLPREN